MQTLHCTSLNKVSITAISEVRMTAKTEGTL
jgi:hypothetical protein